MIPNTDQALHRGNRILRDLAPESFDRLLPHLRQETLAHHETVYRVGKSTNRIWFVDDGLISLVRGMRDGRTVEVGAIGVADAAGAPALFGFEDVWFETIVQVPGAARSIATDRLANEVARNPRLAALLRGSIHIQIEQMAQTSACNRLHSLDQRCARWLLIADDNTLADEFVLTHDFLATMLGTHRPAVSMAMSDLHKRGFIRNTRSQVTIIDRDGLEAACCECYSTIHELTERIFTPFEEGFGQR